MVNMTIEMVGASPHGESHLATPVQPNLGGSLIPLISVSKLELFLAPLLEQAAKDTAIMPKRLV